MSFGEVLVRSRNKAGLQQKELATLIKKKDGESISPAYLNDLEHDRRNPSDYLIEQFASILIISADYLYHCAGILPPSLRNCEIDETQVITAYEVFKTALGVTDV